MESFKEVYARLNQAQREAVDAIYGPVLVIAGPGTGKTQLLSARVARILTTTDTLPQNILCLTFTENGALNMRERLGRFIGKDAYNVHIGTYHAFGRTIIGRYPEYFTDIRLERPVDELGKRQILAAVIDKVDYRSPIKQVRHHLGDLMATVSEVKRGLLTPDDLRAIAAENKRVIDATAEIIGDTLAPYAARMPSKIEVAEPLYRKVLDALLETAQEPTAAFPHYGTLAAAALETALEAAAVEGKTPQLTAWKNKWLVKNSENRFMLAGSLEAARIAALAGVFEQYQVALDERGLYDFDDMILRAISVLETNDDLRYTLQEQYQFILLDEFQDTNAAQLRLVQLLTDNPVHEGRPNVLAVGDDDQAIYAFQGAQYSNMLDFYTMYRDVTVVSLKENYRSADPILQTATAVAAQIESRLHHRLATVDKSLIARAANLPALTLERREYLSDIAERAGIARQIRSLIDNGVAPSDIAILAPKHKYLEPLVPYLQDADIAVSYEKREDILKAPVIRELLTMSKLVMALHHNQITLANSLWPEVLSYEFWGLSVADIWQAAWQANDERHNWAQVLLAINEFRHAALLMLSLAGRVTTDNYETMLDALIGTSDVQTGDTALPSVRSPLRDFYFKKQGDGILFETATELTVLRSRLREHQAGQSGALGLKDLLDFVAEYEAAEEQMLNTSPYNQSSDAVQLMTVYKAKGLEFAHVFLPTCHNDVWGSASSGMSNKLTLPANLTPIRHAGATEDERLRLLFVALTRAKAGLHLSSYRTDFAGKIPERLKYFDEVTDGDKTTARTLPAAHATVIPDDTAEVSLATLQLEWQMRHLRYHDTPLRELLTDRLRSYRLSPTHLTHFIDLEHGGPEAFLFDTLLRFPRAPNVSSSFGSTIHDTLEWVQQELNKTGRLPSVAAATKHAGSYLDREPLSPGQVEQEKQHAKDVLSLYLDTRGNRFVRGNMPEKSFHDEGVVLGQDVHLNGKIDLLEIDKETKNIVVVDYKTGRPEKSWKPETNRLHRYAMQLYCYKLLVENSATYRDYTVTGGRLEFVEPDQDGKLHALELMFDQAETDRVRHLLQALWRRVKSLDLPDVSSYGTTLSSIKQFETDLLERGKEGK